MLRFTRQSMKTGAGLLNYGRIVANETSECSRWEQGSNCTNFVASNVLGIREMHFMLPWKVNCHLTLDLMKSQVKYLQMLQTRSIRLYVTMQTNQTCWKCQRSLDNQKEQFFCDCGVIQPPNNERTFFEVLGIETSFDVDSRQLTQKFRQLQSYLHPDKFTQKTAVRIAINTFAPTKAQAPYFFREYLDPVCL